MAWIYKINTHIAKVNQLRHERSIGALKLQCDNVLANVRRYGLLNDLAALQIVQ